MFLLLLAFLFSVTRHMCFAIVSLHAFPNCHRNFKCSQMSTCQGFRVFQNKPYARVKNSFPRVMFQTCLHVCVHNLHISDNHMLEPYSKLLGDGRVLLYICVCRDSVVCFAVHVQCGVHAPSHNDQLPRGHNCERSIAMHCTP